MVTKKKKRKAAAPMATPQPEEIIEQAQPAAAAPDAGDNKPEAGSDAEPHIAATPFLWKDPAKIPPRSWLLGRHQVRNYVTATYAAGGSGKSMLALTEGISIASGKPLLGIAPEERANVWYWNGEDPGDELDRRVMAVAKHYGLKPEDINGRLFVDSGRKMPIIIVTEVKSRYGGIETRVTEPVKDAVIATIKANNIALMIVDPFVSSHAVNENDNNAINKVAKAWAEIAEETNCSIELVHHTRKTGGNGASAEDGRGASSLMAAARSVRTLNTMTSADAKAAGIDEDARRPYFRVDNGKANLAPPERASWYKIVSVSLNDWDDDDTTGVVIPFTYPEKKFRPTGVQIERVRDKLKADGPWRADQRSKKEPWVGVPIAEVLGANLEFGPDRMAIIGLIKKWVAQGVLKEVDRKDARHETRKYIEVGETTSFPAIADADDESDDPEDGL
jgi:hypothetical protein